MDKNENNSEKYAYVIFWSKLWEEPEKVWVYLNKEEAMEFIKRALIWDDSFVKDEIDNEIICWTSQKFKKHIQLSKVKLVD